MSLPPWVPKEGVPDSQHLRDLSLYVSRNLPALSAAVGKLANGTASAQTVYFAGSSPEDAIDESQVTFDDETGHDHTGDGGTGTPIPFTGDTTGDNTANVNEAIQGIPIPAPASPGDDGKAIVYNDAGPAFEYRALAGAGSRSRQTVDGFYANAVAAALTNAPLSRDGSAAAQGFLPVRAGDITGVLVKSDAPVAAGTLTVEVQKNGVGTGLTAQINTTDTTLKITLQAAGLDSFVGGDRISVVVTTTLGFLPITADIRASVEISQLIDAA